MVLAWADPPPLGNRTVAELGARPGEWAHIGTAEGMKAATRRARALREAGRREGATIETATRQEGRHVKIYARLVP